MIEKVQNAWIQIRCEQKSFKRAQVLKNLVVILKLNQKGQILESKTMRSYLNSFTCHGGICSSICNMFHVPVLTHSDASLLISSISYCLNYHFIVFPFLLFSHFVLYYMTDRLTSLWLAESNQIYCYFYQAILGKTSFHMVGKITKYLVVAMIFFTMIKTSRSLSVVYLNHWVSTSSWCCSERTMCSVRIMMKRWNNK